MTILHVLLLASAWTIPCYLALDLWSRSPQPALFYTHVERQVERLLTRSAKSRALTRRLQTMLAASTLASALSVPQFLLLSLLSALAGLLLPILTLHNPYAALLASVVGAVLPYQLLEVDIALTRHRILRRAANFFLTVLNTYGIYGDPILALEHAAPQLAPPFGPAARWFVTAVRHGTSLSTCISTLKNRLPDRTLAAFWDDVAYYSQTGGPFDEALMQRLREVYQREQEASERGVAVGTALTTFLALVAVYLLVLLRITDTNPYITEFLLATLPGKLTVTLMLALLFIALYYLKTALLARDGDL